MNSSTGSMAVKQVMATAMAGALLATAAVAQDGPAVPRVAAQAPAQPSVQGYLCTFAGKCGPDATPAEQPEIDAPDTRGFRLARPAAERPAASAPVRTASPARGYVSPARPAATPGRVRGVRRPAAPAVAQPARAALTSAMLAPVAAVGARPRADLLIGFELNSARLTAQGRESARVFARSLRMPELAAKRFVVEGHTDLRGDRTLNMRLSRARAEAVVDYLAAQGVNRSRLQARGLGPDAPLAGRGKDDPANRRVEAELVP